MVETKRVLLLAREAGKSFRNRKNGRTDCNSGYAANKIYTVKVREELTVEKIGEECKDGFIYRHFQNDEEFGETWTKYEKGNLRFRLFHYCEGMDIRDINKDMIDQGFRPATMIEAYEFTRSVPNPEYFDKTYPLNASDHALSTGSAVQISIFPR